MPVLGHGLGVAAAVWAISRRVARLLVRTVRAYMDDHCATYAAAIAYYAIFSLVPLALVTLSVLGLVVDTKRITDFVFNQLPLKETDSVRANVEEIVRRAREVSVAGLGIGIVTLLWSSSGIFTAIRRGLFVAARGREARPFYFAKLTDFALIPALGLLILLTVGAMAAVQITIEQVGDLGQFGLTTAVATRAVTTVVIGGASLAGFLLLYHFVPRPRPSWRQTALSASFATVLFEISKYSYTILLEITPFTRDTALYAGFGTALTFLLWMFINASILLLGAEFGRAASAGRKVKLDRSTEGFFHPFG